MSRSGSSIFALNSSMVSNTTALPRCLSSLGVAADGLITAPSGARLPRNMAMPALALNGWANCLMTSRFLQVEGGGKVRAELVPVFEFELHPDASGNGQQVHDRVGGTTDGRVGPDGILEGLAREDPGQDEV